MLNTIKGTINIIKISSSLIKHHQNKTILRATSETTILFFQAQSIPFNPRYFPTIHTSPQNKTLKIGSREDKRL